MLAKEKKEQEINQKTTLIEITNKTSEELIDISPSQNEVITPVDSNLQQEQVQEETKSTSEVKEEEQKTAQPEEDQEENANIEKIEQSLTPLKDLNIETDSEAILSDHRDLETADVDFKFDPESQNQFLNEKSFKSDEDLNVEVQSEDRGMEELLDEANKSQDLTDTNTLNQAVDGLDTNSQIVDVEDGQIETDNLLNFVDGEGQDHEEINENKLNKLDEAYEENASEDYDPNEDGDNDDPEPEEFSESEVAEQEGDDAEKMNLNAGNPLAALAPYFNSSAAYTANREMALTCLKERSEKIKGNISRLNTELNKYAKRFASDIQKGIPTFEAKDETYNHLISICASSPSLHFYNEIEDYENSLDILVPFLKLLISFFQPSDSTILMETDKKTIFNKLDNIVNTQWSVNKSLIPERITNASYPTAQKIYIEKLLSQDKNIIDLKAAGLKHKYLGYLGVFFQYFLLHQGIVIESQLSVKSKNSQNFVNAYFYIDLKIKFYETELEKSNKLIADLEC